LPQRGLVFLETKLPHATLDDETHRQKQGRPLENPQGLVRANVGIVIFRDSRSLLVPLSVSKIDFIKDEPGPNAVSASRLVVRGHYFDFSIQTGLVCTIRRYNACHCNCRHEEEAEEIINESSYHNFLSRRGAYSLPSAFPGYSLTPAFGRLRLGRGKRARHPSE
jgi:hypothetical protein